MNQNDIIQNLLNKVAQEIYANAQLTAMLEEKEAKIEELGKELEENKKYFESINEGIKKEGD